MAPVVKNPPANAGDARYAGSIPGSGRSPEEGLGNPVQYSCLENPLDRVAWRATVHRVAKSQTQLKHVCVQYSMVMRNEIENGADTFLKCIYMDFFPNY